MFLVSETSIDRNRDCILSQTEPYEPFTEDIGLLFRNVQRFHGRCESKVYVDTQEGTCAVGWVFAKTEAYLDTGEPYVRETWITLHDRPDEVIRIPHLHFLPN